MQARSALLRAQPGWRTTWDIIVPGHFGGSGSTDLLFYDRETGTAQFYSTEGGAIHQLRTYANFRTTWHSIIPGNFGGDGYTDLLFYDRNAGYGEFYTTDGRGGMRLLRSHANWRRSWDIIVPGQFGGDGRTDLLFYDRAARQGEFHKTDGRGGMVQLRLYEGWRDTWNVIVSGNFGEGSGSDLLFYDRAAGWGEFYRNVGEARLTQLRAFDNWRRSWSQVVAGDFGRNGWTDLLFYEGRELTVLGRFAWRLEAAGMKPLEDLQSSVPGAAVLAAAQAYDCEAQSPNTRRSRAMDVPRPAGASTDTPVQLIQSLVKPSHLSVFTRPHFSAQSAWRGDHDAFSPWRSRILGDHRRRPRRTVQCVRPGPRGRDRSVNVPSTGLRAVVQDPLPGVRHFGGEDHIAVDVEDLRQGSTRVVISRLRYRVDTANLEVSRETSCQVRDELERRICEGACSEVHPGAMTRGEYGCWLCRDRARHSGRSSVVPA